MSPEFLLTSLIVVASPGTGVLYTLGAGLGRGGRAAVIAAFGCTLGILPHLLAAVLGLSAMIETSAVAFEILRVAGVAYLLYMAWMTLKETGALAVAPDGRDGSAFDITFRAILLNLLNPKLTVFFLAFLPQFVGSGEAAPTLRFVELGGVFMAMTFVVFALYGVAAAGVRDRVLSRPAVLAGLRRLFAGAFVLLGLKLALADQR
ncbi:LysE family translocator [Pleomorphomonas koreensis]|uniref:LysE family translocator n=1 Tax=Pleomorphomonas koreensis TaxID=257440 RepID=UPI00047CE0CC|nr:LysE family translocator [Pleomorphomonas koreensis]